MPKGPSTDPREKRLAIETEDHQEIADAVFELCSAGATFVTGQPLAVEGGFTVP